MQVGSACPLTQCGQEPSYPPNALNVGGMKPNAPVQSGNRTNPKLFRAGGSGHSSGECREPRHSIPQCLPGTTLSPGACWGRAATPPQSATLFALQGSMQGRSPGQPAARGSAGALLLFTHSLLRPRGRHRDFCLHAPQYTADRLGPGPSPEPRPVGPAVGHSGIWSPPAHPTL